MGFNGDRLLFCRVEATQWRNDVPFTLAHENVFGTVVKESRSEYEVLLEERIAVHEDWGVSCPNHLR